MKPYLVIICLSILLASSAFAADDSKPNSSVENEPVAPVINDETIKQKRGIIGHSAFPYTPVPSIGLHRYPIAKVAQYHITPGSAASYSYSINYPKVLHPRPFYRHAFLPAPAPYPVHAPAPYPVHAPAPVPSPVLFHNRPILQAPAPAHIPFSLYGERYPVLAHKPITPIEAPFSYAPPVVHSNILPPVNSDAFGLRPHIIPNAIPHSTIVSQDGWRPLSTPIHTPTISVHSAKPAINILPPIATQHSAGGGLVQRPSNFYLPVDTPQFQDATPHSHEALIHADGSLSFCYFLWEDEVY